jgi:hypothetical protein
MITLGRPLDEYDWCPSEKGKFCYIHASREKMTAEMGRQMLL